MSEILNIPATRIIPDVEAILRAQGIGGGKAVDKRVLHAAEKAIRTFADLAEPVAIAEEIIEEVFAPIYHGLGQNAVPAPIEKIYQQADYLMLFAATVGRRISGEIRDLFTANEFVLGNALDVAASEGTDRISHVLEEHFKHIITTRSGSDTTVLAYSPGYCGWHISAQKLLFEALHPEKIGITLRESYLMEPLKSISGVLIAGKRSIHQIDNSYEFCADCQSEPCRARMIIDEEKKT